MDPRSIEALHLTVEAGLHRPGRAWDQLMERRRAGLPDQVPSSIKDPAERHRFAAAQQRCNKYAAAANKGV